MSAPPLVLASGSPRRRQLLKQLGLRFEVDVAEVDESERPGEPAAALARRLALTKARAVAERRPDALVVGGDTVVTLHGALLGKPADERAAVAALLRLQGHEHRVETGVAVVAPGGRHTSDVVGADVRFRRFDRALAEAYVATGEPMDKAGGYGIQGLGAVLVESMKGDYFAVMGLPLSRLVGLLVELGWAYRFGTELSPIVE